jgi:DNA polymerase III subunit beta
MRIVTGKEILLKAINIAESIISSKSINTVLANCLMIVKKDFTEVISTDNEVSTVSRIKASSDSEGSFTVNGKKLSNLLKELPEDDIIIDVSDNMGIDIKSASKDVKGHYTLIGGSAEEYPEITRINQDESIEIEQSVLKNMIKKVSYAASNDTIKPVFNGIYMISEPVGSITAVATDSRRLSLITREIDNDIDISEGIIVPLKTISEIQRLLEPAGRCLFSYSDKKCFFKVGETEVISRIVDGQFPNYKQVIPKEQSMKAVINTRKLTESVKRVMVFTREPVNKIILTFSKNKLQIDARTSELGEANEELVIECSAKEDILIGINAMFLLDTLKEIDDEFFICGITGQMSPVTITTEKDKNHVSVIMPIQLK